MVMSAVMSRSPGSARERCQTQQTLGEVQWQLQGTQTELAATKQALAKAEAEVQQTGTELTRA